MPIKVAACGPAMIANGQHHWDRSAGRRGGTERTNDCWAVPCSSIPCTVSVSGATLESSLPCSQHDTSFSSSTGTRLTRAVYRNTCTPPSPSSNMQQRQLSGAETKTALHHRWRIVARLMANDMPVVAERSRKSSARIDHPVRPQSSVIPSRNSRRKGRRQQALAIPQAHC